MNKPKLYNEEAILAAQAYATEIMLQKQDALDRASLEFIKMLKQKTQKINALDLGGGQGIHSKRMSVVGAATILFDLRELPENAFTSFGHDGVFFPEVIHVQKNFLEITEADIPNPLHIIYSQRALNYLRYEEMVVLLKKLYNALEDQGAIFISLAGYDTEYGLTHEKRDAPLAERFGMVSAEMQERHNMYQNICVYTEAELITLLKELGFHHIRAFRSPFGNVKACGLKSPQNSWPSLEF